MFALTVVCCWIASCERKWFRCTDADTNIHTSTSWHGWHPLKQLQHPKFIILFMICKFSKMRNKVHFKKVYILFQLSTAIKCTHAPYDDDNNDCNACAIHLICIIIITVRIARKCPASWMEQWWYSEMGFIGWNINAKWCLFCSRAHS